MNSVISLCSDLDRTLLPNGFQEESPRARLLLRRIAKRPEITLVYVSGRNETLIQEAIDEYDLPVPDYAIGDVGTTLYCIESGRWKLEESWLQHIGKDWKDLTNRDLAELLEDIDELQLQEPEKQNRYKLSYYTDPNVDYRQLVSKIHRRLETEGVKASAIWSMDETSELGLLDILPQYATKLQAIKFLSKFTGIPVNRTVFAGDSGNDLDALTSGMQAVLVKNASEDVRREALDILSRKQMTDCLYLARGNFMDMNGNYAAGVLEGLAYFFPETEKWIREAINDFSHR